MDWIKNWLFKNAIAQGLRALLDKLPANGKKTILGILVLVLGEVLRAYPAASFTGYLAVILEIVNSLGPENITDAGIVTIIVGLVHKLLKLFDNDDKPEPPKLVEITKK